MGWSHENILAPKLDEIQMGPIRSNGDFHKTDLRILSTSIRFMETVSLNKIALAIS
jgi:hypothetical protein